MSHYKSDGDHLMVYAVDTSGVPKTGDAANITCQIRKDGGSWAATNDVNPTEDGNGYYTFTLTAAETSARRLDFRPIIVSGNVCEVKPSLTEGLSERIGR